jgi:hypothetical protein
MLGCSLSPFWSSESGSQDPESDKVSDVEHPHANHHAGLFLTNLFLMLKVTTGDYSIQRELSAMYQGRLVLSLPCC